MSSLHLDPLFSSSRRFQTHCRGRWRFVCLSQVLTAPPPPPDEKKKHHHSLNLLHSVWCVLRGQLIGVLLYDSLKVARWVRKVTVEVWRGRHLGSSSSSSGSRARPRRRFHTHSARRSHQPKKVKCACFILRSF